MMAPRASSIEQEFTRNSVARAFITILLIAAIPVSGIALHQQNGNIPSKDKNVDAAKKPSAAQGKPVTVEGEQTLLLSTELVSITVTVADS
jgi:hypothetical protein